MVLDPLRSTRLQAANPTLHELVAGFAESPNRCARAMRELLNDDPSLFHSATIGEIRLGEESRGLRYLLTLLLSNGLLFRLLCDPELGVPDAGLLLRLALRVDPTAYAMVARSMIANTSLTDGELSRIMAVLSASSEKSGTAVPLTPLLHHPDARIRSKAVILMGRASRNVAWVERRPLDDDERVRGNAVEAIWDVESERSRSVLWEALNDPSNRVAGNALRGLYRLGEIPAIPEILNLSTHQEARFRSTAAWVMGETGDSRFTSELARLLRDPSEVVRKRAFLSLKRVHEELNRASAAGALRVSLRDCGPAEPGWRALTAAVLGDGEGLPELLPTQFVLSEDGAAISEFRIEARPVPGELAVLLVLPQAENGQPTGCEEVVSRCLERKRAADRWVVLRYSREARQVPLGPTVVFADAHGRALVDVAKLGACAMADEAAIPLWPTIRTAAAAFARSGSAHHVIVFSNQPIPQDTEDLKWRDAVRATVHAVSCTPDAALRRLCLNTSGSFFSSPDPGEIAACFERVYLGLLARYRIVCRANTGPLKLQVYSADGFGEDVLSIPGAAVHPETPAPPK